MAIALLGIGQAYPILSASPQQQLSVRERYAWLSIGSRSLSKVRLWTFQVAPTALWWRRYQEMGPPLLTSCLIRSILKSVDGLVGSCAIDFWRSTSIIQKGALARVIRGRQTQAQCQYWSRAKFGVQAVTSSRRRGGARELPRRAVPPHRTAFLIGCVRYSAEGLRLRGSPRHDKRPPTSWATSPPFCSTSPAALTTSPD